MLLANFDRKEHLQHRAVSLRQHGFLVFNSSRRFVPGLVHDLHLSLHGAAITMHLSHSLYFLDVIDGGRCSSKYNVNCIRHGQL